ncbi:SMODS domain-containing nucleotidyltransferase [Amycolatopsis sp. cmx-4-54]|uniref:SMODS domain-containing nucleotidyltransferase n=1 Tax=Amycolatopsis sp. cmx-4-54 TaxID=2790936 RepID=UPI00397C2D49
MSTISQSFASFIETIEPTKYHLETLIPARKKSAIENLEETFPAGSSMPFMHASLMGSAEKKTIVRPIDDIDVLAVFSNEKDAYYKYQFDSKNFLYRIRQAYDGVSTQQVGARGQAVRVFFQSGGHVDVAPVFPGGGDDYLLPSGNGGWITTSPFKANRWFTGRNQDLGNNLRPLVRLLKKWNREHSSRLSSFHLETMAATVFTKLGSDRRTALKNFFEWAPSFLVVQDPGGHSGDLSSYLTWSSRQDVIRSFEAAKNRCEKAIEAESVANLSEARRLWRIVLGEDFPG